MENIEKIIKNTTEKNQKEVNIPKYANEIRKMLNELQEIYHYNELDAMLVLKDILAHEYLDKSN